MNPLAMVLLATIGAIGVASSAPAELVELNEKYEEAKARIQEPKNELDEAYRTQLAKIRSQAQTAGDLETILIADEEAKAFRERANVIPKTHGELRKARETYDQSVQNLQARFKVELRRLDEAYLGQLEHLQKTLTQQGRVQDALAVKGLADNVQARFLPESNAAASDLVGHWTFDLDGRDQSGRGLHASLVGAEIVEGRLGSGALKTGEGKYAEVVHHPDLLMSGPFTLALWIKKEKGDPQSIFAPILSKGSMEWRIQLSPQGTTPCFHLSTSAGNLQANSREDDFREGRWQHVAGVFDGKVVTLHLDGHEAASGSSRAAFKVNTQFTNNIRFGGMSNLPDRFFTGLIDDVRIYKRALTRVELLRLADGKELDN